MAKSLDHDVQRRQILEKSFPFFAESGYVGLSIRRLALGLGVTSGTLYHYFRNKEEIFEAMMQQIMTDDAEAKMAFLVEYPDPVAKMRALGRSFEQQKNQLRLQTILCGEYCRHLQEQGRSTLAFWGLVKPRYRALCKLILGYENPLVFELVSTFIHGLLTRLSWGDEPEDMGELLAEFAGCILPRFGPSS
ncbi:TetR/AcrR family transcriptional regulator [bacterium]|nr:TetR/AcrR family transcriptional regulator [bacterium]